MSHICYTCTTQTKMAGRTVYLVTSGDSRVDANKTCWPAQATMEEKLTQVFQRFGWELKRAHEFNELKGHGFIDSQRMGLDVFNQSIPTNAPIVSAICVWQYSYFLVPGMLKHNGPILNISSWSGQWPGLVGLLNLNASLTRFDRPYSTLWSETFDDEFFISKLKEWLRNFDIQHDMSHVKSFIIEEVPSDINIIGRQLSDHLKANSAIMGIFDEGCMGMLNACFPVELLHKMSIFKEPLSQSALLAEMKKVTDEEGVKIRQFVEEKGMQFITGPNEKTDLTDWQILQQCKMYIAAIRIAYHFSCDMIGIQYQQGLKDTCPASDLAEGLMNCSERPPVYHIDDSTKELFPGLPVIHFNEVDQGAGIDALITNRVWMRLDLDSSTTLHDIRYGEFYNNQFVWVLEISGSVPPSHLTNGYAGAIGERQPPMYFPLGGSTIKGISRPGFIVWSRLFVFNNELHIDMGIGDSIELPDEENQRRWEATTSQWPMMHLVLRGITRDQFMARHKANHILVAYAPTNDIAKKALLLKAVMFHELGVNVYLCGDI